MAETELAAYYLSVFDEPAEQAEDAHALRLLREYEAREQRAAADSAADDDDPASGRAAAAEPYEEVVARHGDAVFDRFTEVIARYPSQVLRYHVGGQALPVRPASRVPEHPPPCMHCGGPTACELQLLPGLVSHLRAPLRPADEPVTFASVALMTCRRSCGPAHGSRREHIFVDPEETVVLPSAAAEPTGGKKRGRRRRKKKERSGDENDDTLDQDDPAEANEAEST